MKKLFLIFTFTLVSFLFSSFVFAQNNNQANTQQIQDLLQRAQDDSTCAAESTDSNDSITGGSNSNPSASCANVKKDDGIYFTPNVPIPGFFEGTIQITPNSIATYINAVYRYGAGLAGVIAMFMIVFAAWQWIIAAGNAGKIENAKETIIGALIGLALLFGGYLLLAQISSKLVNLGDLKVTHIPTIKLPPSSAFGTECSGLAEAACQAKSDVCMWDWNAVTNTGICIDKGMCGLSFDKAYEQRNNNRLICCGDGSNFQYALKGSGLQNSCGQICGDGFEEKTPMGTFCGRSNCMELGETACKAKVGLCRWNEDATNTCLEEAHQAVLGSDCNENSDCSIYDSNYCCNSADLFYDECRLRSQSGIVCYP